MPAVVRRERSRTAALGLAGGFGMVDGEREREWVRVEREVAVCCRGSYCIVCWRYLSRGFSDAVC